jgi:hypothetical protein
VPYITSESNSNRQDSLSAKTNGNAGFDAKVALSSSLNVDLTVNPDFSQVEVDRQVPTLPATVFSFLSDAHFFLENAVSVCRLLVYHPYGPFYSRRIGLDNKGNRIPITIWRQAERQPHKAYTHMVL